MDFDFFNELNTMRERYREQPMSAKRLPRPIWMTKRDPLSVIYREKEELLAKGEVYYGHLVQANMLLFRPYLWGDSPACLVYSDAKEVNEFPFILEDIADELYSYKDVPDSEIPEHMKTVVASIKNEYCRDSFSTIYQLEDGKEVTIYFKVFTVFRKFLPGRRLKGSLMPILARPEELESIMILPKQYWCKEFKEWFW